MLMLVAWFCTRHGRLYCNTVCPVGTLLGLVSKVSLFRIEIDKKSCRGCKLCQNVCKACCIDLKKNKVDASRCVGRKPKAPCGKKTCGKKMDQQIDTSEDFPF